MKHCHKYKVVKAKKGYGNSISIFTLKKTGSNIPITTILYKCKKCHKLKTENIEGHYTLGEVG